MFLEFIAILEKHNCISVELASEIKELRVLMDEDIKFEYKQLRKSSLKGKDAIVKLAEKYCLSEKSIEHILYLKTYPSVNRLSKLKT